MATWKHNPISQKAGGPNAVGQPGGFAWEGDHTQHVVYRGEDNQIHEVWFKKGGFNPEWKYGGAISALAGGPLAEGDPFGFAWEGDHTQHVIYRGVDHELHELWFHQAGMNPKWQYGGALTQKAGAPAASGDPFGFAWEDDHTMHVIYRGVDNNVHELWFSKGLANAAWKYGGAINSKVSAPAATGDVAGFVWDHDHSQHIIYHGTDNNIHELWFTKGFRSGEWKHGGALNSMAGAPPAASDAMGFAWEGDHTQHVIYRGQDNQVHELWFTKGLTGGAWKYGGAISATTAAPLADGMPYGYSGDNDKTMHIVYRGQDKQVHELWFAKGLTGSSWKYGAAVNRIAGAPDAASDPVGFAWEDDHSQHVIYRGNDAIIHELWFKK